jgi:surface protein
VLFRSVMNKLFCDCIEFNDDISRWDVSNVTDMSSMFEDAYVFNQPIGGWNVSKVTNMNKMFDIIPVICCVIG